MTHRTFGTIKAYIQEAKQGKWHMSLSNMTREQLDGIISYLENSIPEPPKDALDGMDPDEYRKKSWEALPWVIAQKRREKERMDRLAAEESPTP